MTDSGIDLGAAYEAELGHLGYQADDSQIRCIEHLQRLTDELVYREARREDFSNRLRRWLKRPPPAGIQGLYLWGGVGRGKTFLMDLFFRSLPVAGKERVHFHRFMLSIHRDLHASKHVDDPLAQVARRISSRVSVLCFDELFVADITDAMVLARLFTMLVEHGVVLVITSNTEPRNLYRNGLQRERFLPAIDLIESHCQVINMDGGTDYRLQTLTSSEVYLCPHNEDAIRTLERTFRRLVGDGAVNEAPLPVLGRDIPVRMAGEGVCWFDFHDLCEGPRSKADYAEVSRFFHTVLISDIPMLGMDGDDPARRFIELIDELYDRRVNVLVSAAALPEALYRGKRLAHGFNRTASRLREFADPRYMAAEHRP
jgi:cell division protein ZapE